MAKKKSGGGLTQHLSWTNHLQDGGIDTRGLLPGEALQNYGKVAMIGGTSQGQGPFDERGDPAADGLNKSWFGAPDLGLLQHESNNQQPGLTS